MNPRVSFRIFLFILGMWLGLTCFIDFYAVPNVFRNVSSREEAGTLGMNIFSTFNILELIFSFLLMATSLFFFRVIKWKKSFFTSLIFLILLVGVYLSVMTPKIISLNTQKWELAETDPQYQVLEKEHLFYHQLFTKTDSLKILILLGLTLSMMKVNTVEEDSL